MEGNIVTRKSLVTGEAQEEIKLDTGRRKMKKALCLRKEDPSLQRSSRHDLCPDDTALIAIVLEEFYGEVPTCTACSCWLFHTH